MKKNKPKETPDPTAAEIAAHEQKVYRAAVVAHQANKQWCEFHGDNSQKDWENTAEEQQQLTIKDVELRIAHPNGTGDVNDDELTEFQKKQRALFLGVVDALIK